MIHVFLYYQNTDETGKGIFKPASNLRVLAFSTKYWDNGVYGIVGLAFITFIFSWLPLRAHLYEVFLLIHIGLAIFILYGVWWHVTYRYHHTYGYQIWLYIAFASWGIDRLIRPIRIILLNWKSWFIGSHPSAIVELLPGDQLIRVTAFPSRAWDFSAGQHCYLYFPTLLTNPFQSHPFSIAGWDRGNSLNAFSKSDATSDSNPSPNINDLPPAPSYPNAINLATIDPSRLPQPIYDQDNSTRLFAVTQPLKKLVRSSSQPSITFLIRPEKGLTATLQRRLLKSRTARVPIMIEGPYGPTALLTLTRSDTIVAIAGGIGITSILSYLRTYLENRNDHATTRFCIYWRVRERSIVDAVRGQLGDLEELRGKGVEVNIFCNEEGAPRKDVRDIVFEEVMGDARAGRSTCVVGCGPGAMGDRIRAAVVECIGRKGVRVEYIEEAFCW